MLRQMARSLLLVTILFGSVANADEIKQLKVESGKATIFANLISARPDCSTNPGAEHLPLLSEKPLHGYIGLQIGITNVPASETCPKRKIPSIALFYVSPVDYLGTDSFQIEIDEDNNKQAKISYQVTVQASPNN